MSNMRAILLKEYGDPDNLRITETAKPVPLKNQVLIRIVTTTVNDYDWSMVTGTPRLYRLLFGLFRPKHAIPGMELAGIVEEVGPDATTFQPGDEVYGDISEYGFGTMAEYIVIDERAVVRKPDGMSFEEAAALPHASLLAYQSLFPNGESLKAGARVLINGGGGGVGTLGLQMCKIFGAHVTGVDTGDKLKMMEQIGFDRVIDYKKEDFTATGEKYDVILDTKSTRSAGRCRRALSPNGRYVTVGGESSKILSIAIAGLFNKKRTTVLALKPNKHMDKVERWFLEGKVKPVIDGPYDFGKLPWAIGYFGKGLHGGKVVISVSGGLSL